MQHFQLTGTQVHQFAVAYFNGEAKVPSVRSIAASGGSSGSESCVRHVVVAFRRAESLAYQGWLSTTQLSGRIECDATTLKTFYKKDCEE
eukprot:876830-Karenia_brevis.AAC.1